MSARWTQRLGLLVAMAIAAPNATAQTMSQQEAQAEAKSLGNRLRLQPGNGVFDTDTVEDTVTPFETAAPPESGIAPSDLENETNEALLGSSTAAEAHQASRDSITLRPDYEVLPTDPGFSVAREAVNTAEQSLDGTFKTSGSGLCNVDGFTASEPFERFCDVFTQDEVKSCKLSRINEVDRRDTWQCDWKQEFSEKTCSVSYTPSCTSTPNCRAGSMTASLVNRVSASSVTASWNSAGTTLSGSSGRTISTDSPSFPTESYEWNLTAQPRFQPQELTLTTLTAWGAASVYARVGTSGTWTLLASARGRILGNWLMPTTVSPDARFTIPASVYGTWAPVVPVSIRIVVSPVSPPETTNGWHNPNTKVSYSLTVEGPCCDSISWTETEQCGG